MTAPSGVPSRGPMREARHTNDSVGKRDSTVGLHSPGAERPLLSPDLVLNGVLIESCLGDVRVRVVISRRLWIPLAALCILPGKKCIPAVARPRNVCAGAAWDVH